MHLCLLALETATEYCSVALLKDNQVFSHAQHCKNQHAAKLLAMIEDVLHQAQINLQDLDAIAFGCGPGSFTGVRIAISVAQGLAYGLQKPVIPISTLQIMAQTAYQQYGVKCAQVALDARMQQIYYAVYALDAKALMQPQGESKLLFPKEMLVSTGQGVGNGWQVYADELNHAAGEVFYPDVMPLASAALVLAQDVFIQGGAIEPAQAAPIYLRDNVAHKKDAKVIQT
jgi:tRNA threonylcarbamoyladenosine biosynthesis protein TsaB